MSTLTIDVVIDGETYSQRQLDLFQYQRALHVMHELKYLGADLVDDDVELTHEDINWLEPARLQEISLEFRAALGEQGVLDLFAGVLADTERRFEQFTAGYVAGDMWTGQTDLSVTGVTVPEFLPVLSGASSHDALSIMPEHYIVVGSVTEGQRGMETFGMFGEPAYVHGVAATEVPEHFPFTKDPDYPLAMFGELAFRQSDRPLHLGAFHQFRPNDAGFDMRSIFFCPKKLPRAMADGHGVHFAIELCNAIKTAHARKTKPHGTS